MSSKHTSLKNINFSDLRKIAKLVSGKKATAENLLRSGAAERARTFNLASIYLSRGVSLACSARGVLSMLDNLHSELGDDIMRELTISTSVVDMLTLTAKTTVDGYSLMSFLTTLSIRNIEYESLPHDN